MIRKVLRNGCVAMLTAGMLAATGSAQNSAAPDKLRLELAGNFITLDPGHWESSGAFIDEGIIADVSKHEPNGNPLHAANLSVIETLSSNRGSFTWKFTRHFSPVPGASAGPVFRTGGAWQLIGGTGEYTGITGQGVINGRINVETGELNDTYTGHVRLAP